MTTPGLAAGAYASIARIADPTAGAAQAAAPAAARAGTDFGALVTDSLNGVVETGKAAEQSTVDLLQGKSNIVDVVTAVAETEVAMETLVSVRDRVISAYEEIMRMPI
ncbi:MAG: flagellar hook-basal body complex protein FliE [Pseudomonadota bacterium]